jgi:hypothetical protein
MTTRALFGLFLAMSALFAYGTRFAPQLVARLAFVPVRRRVAIPLPRLAALVVTPTLEAGGKYRELPARTLVLEALPGESRIERDGQMVRFEPVLGCVLAHRKGSPTQLLRVDISVGVDELILRARRFPATELSFVAIFLAGIFRSHDPRALPFWIVATIAVGAFAVKRLRRAEEHSMGAVVAELRERVALANGDPMPPKPPLAVSMGSRFTGPDEWTCACEKVNARKRSLCSRCWSQRPNG